MNRLYLILLISISFISCNKEKIKSNAQIIGFDSRKCGCCWGGIIKISNDTIKSESILIADEVGYKIESPINVFIELGEPHKECLNSKFDYYKLIKIEKIK